MSASLAFLAALQQISIPLGPTPRQVERPVAPIETAGPAFARACKDFDEWDKPAPPVRIHGNTWYVGTRELSAILVTGPQGHVLFEHDAMGHLADQVRSTLRRHKTAIVAKAVLAWRDLGGGGAFIPMHWGTFRLTDEDPLEPPVRVRAAWAAADLPPGDLHVLRHGETLIL